MVDGRAAELVREFDVRTPGVATRGGHALGRQHPEGPARPRAELRPEGRRLPQADLRARRQDDRDRPRPDPTSSRRAAARRSSSRPTSTSCSRSATGSPCSRAAGSSAPSRTARAPPSDVGRLMVGELRRPEAGGLSSETALTPEAPLAADRDLPGRASATQRARARRAHPLDRAGRARARRRRHPAARARAATR